MIDIPTIIQVVKLNWLRKLDVQIRVNDQNGPKIMSLGQKWLADCHFGHGFFVGLLVIQTSQMSC